MPTACLQDFLLPHSFNLLASKTEKTRLKENEKKSQSQILQKLEDTLKNHLSSIYSYTVLKNCQHVNDITDTTVSWTGGSCHCIISTVWVLAT